MIGRINAHTVTVAPDEAELLTIQTFPSDRRIKNDKRARLRECAFTTATTAISPVKAPSRQPAPLHCG